MNILLLEDDISLQKGISLKLTKEGHEIFSINSIAKARHINWNILHMAILDINLPDGSGLDICREMREKSKDIHILILTADDTETDMVMGYDLGADDYMTKPFSLSVLLSKINAVKRRIDNNTQIKTFEFDMSKQSITIHGKKIPLTRNETRLFYALSKNIGQVLTKEQLLEALWDIDGDFVNENTLAVNIRRLREKIEDDPASPNLIENVRGVGYRLNKDRN